MAATNRRLTTRSIIIAAGAKPFVPPLPGIEESGYLTSDTLWDALLTREEVPERLVILGGGPIGCELAQCFARLGAQVTQVEKGGRIMAREDVEVSALARAALENDGVIVLTDHGAVRCVSDDQGRAIIVQHQGVEKRLPYDILICAVGRTARLAGYGLAELDIRTDEDGVDQRLSGNPVPQYLRGRRCRRPIPVHPYRRPSGVVCGGQRPVWRMEEDSRSIIRSFPGRPLSIRRSPG